MEKVQNDNKNYQRQSKLFRYDQTTVKKNIEKRSKTNQNNRYMIIESYGSQKLPKHEMRS